MSFRTSLPLAAALLAASIAASIATAGEPPPEAGHREQPDDPPAPAGPEALPRSPQAVVIRGNHRSVQVNVDAAGNNIIGDAANEPSIAVDPTNPLNLVIGWRQFDSVASNFRQAGWAYSHDGGASWTFPGVLQPGQFRSDPVLGADSDGVFYYYSLSTATSVELFRSLDKGLSWIGPVGGFGGDKQWLTVDVSGGAGDGNLYALWNSQFTCCDPFTDTARSIDGGLSFQGPYVAPIKTKWGTLDVGPDGELYIAGANLDTLASPGHFVLRSPDALTGAGPPTYDVSRGVDLGGVTVAAAAPNPQGLLGQVWIAVDRSAGPTRGNVYILASVDPPGPDPMDVHVIRSTDGGSTWSAPLRVNDVATGYQWFATVAVGPSGRLDVIWNDTRHDPTGETSETYYAFSTDGALTWSAGLPVTPAWDSLVGQPNQSKIGDYYHMVSDSTGASLAYAATFNGEQDIWFLRVGDCNGNGVGDADDLAAGTSHDCNANFIPDECEQLAELCGDGSDNDCDGRVDCADPDCAGAIAEVCDDGSDNDCDGAVDCADPDCAGAIDEICQDGADNDCDGLADCQDPECVGTGPCPCDLDGVCEPGEQCTFCPQDCPGGPDFCCGDGACDPGENPCNCGLDCGAFSPAESQCADRIDNDCDGAIDCADVPDCSSDPPPPPPAGIPDVELRPNGGVPLLVWTPLADAVRYDVVEGDVAALRAAGGSFSVAATACVASGTRSPSALAPAIPPAGGVHWLLVRGASCGGPGTWDSGAPSQPASRDAGLEASGNGCP